MVGYILDLTGHEANEGRYGAALGVPLLVDLLDCDVLFPAPYDIIPDTEPAKWPIEPSFMGLAEQLKLSIFVGRVIKTIYSPTGLKHATDDQLESLLADMMSWKASLPDELRFTGPTSSPVAGVLDLSKPNGWKWEESDTF